MIFNYISILLSVFILGIFSFFINLYFYGNFTYKLDNHSNFCVISNIFNPASFERHYRFYRKFEKHILSFGVRLITIELVVNNQEFKVTVSSNPNHIQLRTNDSLWYKENLINIAIRRLSQGCEYVAWVDLEVEFLNENWVRDTKDALKKYKVVQLFDKVNRLGANTKTQQQNIGFGWCNVDGSVFFINFNMFKYVNRKKSFCAPGFAWASTKSAFLKIGGLFDKAIVGDGDSLFAFSCNGLITQENFYYPNNKYYLKEILDYQNLTYEYVNGSLGYVKGEINHLWHGSRSNRNYVGRRKILSSGRVEYKPNEHLIYDSNGLIHFDSEGRKMFSYNIYQYFRSRNEDEVSL